MATPGLRALIARSLTRVLVRLSAYSAFVIIVTWLAQPIPAQESALAQGPAPPQAIAKAKPPRPAPTFFDSEDPLTVTLTANLGNLTGRRRTDTAWRSATL